MKFAVNFLLIVFVIFLSTPTIVSVVKKNTDTSFFYSMSEEEIKHKEIKSDFRFDEPLTIAFAISETSGPILSENLSRHDNVASAIFIPPPEQV